MKQKKKIVKKRKQTVPWKFIPSQSSPRPRAAALREMLAEDSPSPSWSSWDSSPSPSPSPSPYPSPSPSPSPSCSPYSSPSPSPSPISSSPGPMPEGGSKGGTGPAPRLPKEVKIELDKGQKVTIAVQKPAYFAALAAHREITADKVAALTGPVGELEEKSGVLAEKKVGKTGSTLTEAEARAVLETKIAEIQKAARQKFYTRDKNHLKLYQFKLGCSRQDMLDYANTAIIEAGKDSLPGITVDKLVAAAHARVDYINADASKKAAAGERKTVRAQLDSLRLLIKAAREEIQFAADAEWPHTAPANAEVRMEFLLDPNARFKG